MSYTRESLELTTVRLRTASLIVCVTLAVSALEARQVQLSLLTSSPFESYLESLRVQTGIPGMSAALVQDGQIVWERGFGFQNLEARVRATPDTPYPIADMSQTLSAVLVLQCAEQRKLALDDAARRYGGVFRKARRRCGRFSTTRPRERRAKAFITIPSATRS